MIFRHATEKYRNRSEQGQQLFETTVECMKEQHSTVCLCFASS